MKMPELWESLGYSDEDIDNIQQTTLDQEDISELFETGSTTVEIAGQEYVLELTASKVGS